MYMLNFHFNKFYSIYNYNLDFSWCGVLINKETLAVSYDYLLWLAKGFLFFYYNTNICLYKDQIYSGYNDFCN